MDWSALETKDKQKQVRAKLNEAYVKANKIVNGEIENDLATFLTKDEINKALELGATKHAFRGAAVTLLAYKLCDHTQDIRAHKSEYNGGFPARSYDTTVTVPFLIDNSLPRSVESHWLTQTLSFAAELKIESVLKTTPKKAGPLLVEVVNLGNDSSNIEGTAELLISVLCSMIEERNRELVVLTRPKNIPIDVVGKMLNSHFNKGYKNGAPRLPQLAVYAIYQCIVESIGRYDGCSLDALGRMKAADRKAGTVGDIVVSKNKNPTEAVEIKFGQPIALIHLLEAIDKVRAESVSRYYLLSTHGKSTAEEDLMASKTQEFLKQNGCEIIINGVVETICYYLRLLPNTTEFLKNYAGLVEKDYDVGYEHRIAWNQICQQI